MNNSYELSIDISEEYDFSRESLPDIQQNTWVKHQWPLVYFIQNSDQKLAYVGESTNASSRIKNHLANPARAQLRKISIIGSDKFNKSATLDIESNLIQYLSAEGTYQLQNANYGLINHKYYQQDIYNNLFKEVWNRLAEKKIVTRTLEEIKNSELFKFSPYKSLNEDQYNSVLEILDGLTVKSSNRIFISGSAGTGKTILATYLIKLLSTDVDPNQLEDLNEDDLKEITYIFEFRNRYPNAKIGLVVAMTSLRQSLKRVFRKTPGLNPSMIINPSETFKTKEKYDLLIVDEAHRLRQYKNIGWMGQFKKNNRKLGLDDTGTELDWIIANSRNQILFYDANQSVKPSDVDSNNFTKLINDESALKLQLKSQMRVLGGTNYIQFVDDILEVKRNKPFPFFDKDYELILFDSFPDLFSELTKREEEYGLCRMIAGYSWEWVSKPNSKSNPAPNVTDIHLDGLNFKWNTTDNDWINSSNAFNEIGCIHTTQGYDLNYAAIIFGKEINYNRETDAIEINPDEYYDINGKKGISDVDDLKAYIINIYKTIMYRGIRGTFVYAYHKELREYLKEHIEIYRKPIPFRNLRIEDVKPYVNAIPLVNLKAAAGFFSDLQDPSEMTWVEPPTNVSAKEGYYICKVVGESMNLRIPNGSYCLFKKDDGGSRNGKIVLVESTKLNDSELGSGYAVKEYNSIKGGNSEEWFHEKIILKPLSSDDTYEDIELYSDEIQHYRVVGIFVKVLE